LTVYKVVRPRFRTQFSPAKQGQWMANRLGHFQTRQAFFPPNESVEGFLEARRFALKFPHTNRQPPLLGKDPGISHRACANVDHGFSYVRILWPLSNFNLAF